MAGRLRPGYARHPPRHASQAYVPSAGREQQRAVAGDDLDGAVRAGAAAAGTLARPGSIRALGGPVGQPDRGTRRVGGGELRPPRGPLYLDNGGAGVRLVAGIRAGQPFASTLDGWEQLRRRPMRRLTEPLVEIAMQPRDASGPRCVRAPRDQRGPSCRRARPRRPFGSGSPCEVACPLQDSRVPMLTRTAAPWRRPACSEDPPTNARGR